jgi:hypothetical protein
MYHIWVVNLKRVFKLPIMATIQSIAPFEPISPGRCGGPRGEIMCVRDGVQGAWVTGPAAGAENNFAFFGL